MTRSGSSREGSPPDHVTPYDRFAWNDSEIERFLLDGHHEDELTAYFGRREHRELVRLAQQGARRPLEKDVPCVFVVPGIMGSQLGTRRQRPLPDDILWLDPIDIEVGKLAQLRLSERAPIVPLGVVLYSYLRLKLHLRASGFATVFHDYDWRLGVDELGEAFARRLRSVPARRLMIVAHSMGGLVSRAALAQPDLRHVERLVLLGTPNFGSFAPLQALRGTYSVVRKIARLVATGSAEALAQDIFNGFPSLYQMLPVAGQNGGPDLFEPSQWPRMGPLPDVALLRNARRIHERLAPPDERVTSIVGIRQETVTAATRRDDEFVYTVTRHGDGTVPAVSATLPGARNLYAAVAHSDLTRDPVVAAAITDVLRRGSTRRLPTEWRSASAALARIGDNRLRRMHAGKVNWAALEPDERREFLQNLNEPPRLRLRIPSRAAPSRARAAGRRKKQLRRSPSARGPRNGRTRTR